MDSQNFQSYFQQGYQSYNYYDYNNVFYSPTYQNISNFENDSTVSNNYSFSYYFKENEQLYSPTSYYNCYNSSYNSNDSGYLSTSVPSSPNAIKPKTDYSIEVNKEQNLTKKRKLESTEINADQEQATQHRQSNGKRPKVLKLQNLESKDAEYKCEVCLNVFNSAAKFLMHQFVHHKNGNSKQCPVCFRKFGSYSNAMVHLRGHTQEKLYQCRQCDKSFVDISTLKKHQRIHSGEKPFECKICCKKFSQSGNLTRHLATHGDEGKSQSNFYQTDKNDTFYSNQNLNYTYDTYSSDNLDYINPESYSNVDIYNQYQYQFPQNYEFNYYLNY